MRPKVKKRSGAGVGTKRTLLVVVVLGFYLTHQDFWNWRRVGAAPVRLSAGRPLVSCSLFAAGVGLDVAAREIRLAEIAGGN